MCVCGTEGSHFCKLWRRRDLLLSDSPISFALWHCQLLDPPREEPRGTCDRLQGELRTGTDPNWINFTHLILFLSHLIVQPHHPDKLWWNYWHCGGSRAFGREDFLHRWLAQALRCLQHLQWWPDLLIGETQWEGRNSCIWRHFWQQWRWGNNLRDSIKTS